MGNMDYCRFENTVGDLDDCYDAMINEHNLSESETKARKRLIVRCVDIACEYGHEVDMPCEQV